MLTAAAVVASLVYVEAARPGDEHVVAVAEQRGVIVLPMVRLGVALTLI